MLKITERFGKHYSCLLHGECILVGCLFWKLHIEQAVCGKCDVTNIIDGADCCRICNEKVVEEMCDKKYPRVTW